MNHFSSHYLFFPFLLLFPFSCPFPSPCLFGMTSLSDVTSLCFRLYLAFFVVFPAFLQLSFRKKYLSLYLFSCYPLLCACACLDEFLHMLNP